MRIWFGNDLSNPIETTQVQQGTKDLQETLSPLLFVSIYLIQNHFSGREMTPCIQSVLDFTEILVLL